MSPSNTRAAPPQARRQPERAARSGEGSGGGGGLDLAAGRLQLLERLQPGGFVDGRAEVDQDADLERVLAPVEGARPHAVIGGDAAHVDVVDALLFEAVSYTHLTLP